MNRLAAFLTCSLILAGCTGSDPVNILPSTSPSTTVSPGSGTTPSGTPSTSAKKPDSPLAGLTNYPAIGEDAKAYELKHPKSCDDLLGTLKNRAMDSVSAYGLDGAMGYWLGVSAKGTAREGAANASAAQGETGTAPNEAIKAEDNSGHSTTNIQEVGVGEFTRSLTNGKVIATVSEQDGWLSNAVKIHLIDPETLDDLSTVPLPSDLASSKVRLAFANPNTLMVLSTLHSGSGERTVLNRVDISNPKEPKVTSSLRQNGYLIGARLIDEQVVLTTKAFPQGLAFKNPEDRSIKSEREAIEHNKKIIEQSTIDMWLPDAEITNQIGKHGPATVVDCEHVSLTETPSFTFTSVSSVDTRNENLRVNKGAAILGDQYGMYGAKDRIVVWGYIDGDGSQPSTGLVSFDIGDPNAISLAAVGATKGVVDTSWGIDAHHGIYRVASTYYDKAGEQASQATIFQEQSGKLVPVGRVNDLGKDEEIKSVRWLTPDLGVLVTFKQTDPVYTIDTSSPTNPKVVGELKIPGYSAYLHPIGDHKLLGIGQEADPKTGQTLGFKYSLFDISNLADPKELDTLNFSKAVSEAEFDHHGFTWFNDKGYVLLTRLSTEPDPKKRTGDGRDGVNPLTVSGIKIEDDKVVELGRGELNISQFGQAAQTMVIGDRLYGVSESSIGKYDAATIKEEKQRSLKEN